MVWGGIVKLKRGGREMQVMLPNRGSCRTPSSCEMKRTGQREVLEALKKIHWDEFRTTRDN